MKTMAEKLIWGVILTFIAIILVGFLLMLFSQDADGATPVKPLTKRTWVYLKDYGIYSGDTSTFAEFNTVLQKAVGSDLIFDSNATYYVKYSDTSLFPPHDCHIEGRGASLNILASGGSNGIHVRNDNTWVIDLTVALDSISQDSAMSGDSAYGMAIKIGDGYYDGPPTSEVTGIRLENVTVSTQSKGDANIVGINGAVNGVDIVNLRVLKAGANGASGPGCGLIIHWGRDQTAFVANDTVTYHPRNIRLSMWADSLKASDIASALTLSGAMNVTVENSTWEYALNGPNVYCGDWGYNNADPTFYDTNFIDGYGITFRNCKVNSCVNFGYRVDGTPTTLTDTFNMPVQFINCWADQYGQTGTYSGFQIEESDGVQIIGGGAAWFYRGFITGAGVSNLSVRGSIFHHNRQHGAYITNGTLAPENIIVENSHFFNNSTKDSLGAGIYIGTAGKVSVLSNSFGDPVNEYCQKYGVQKTGVTGRTMLFNNYCYGAYGSGGGYYGDTTCIDISNYAATGVTRIPAGTMGKIRFGNYFLPWADGTATYVLATDGSGNVTWTTPSAGSTDSTLTVQYAHVHDSLNLALRLTGGTMTGDIDMGDNEINSLYKIRGKELLAPPYWPKVFIDSILEVTYRIDAQLVITDTIELIGNTAITKLDGAGLSVDGSGTLNADLGPFIDSTSLDTIQYAHKAVLADSSIIVDTTGTGFQTYINNHAGGLPRFLYTGASDTAGVVNSDSTDTMFMYYAVDGWHIYSGADSATGFYSLVKIGAAANNWGGWLKYASNLLQYSNDSGATWANVGSGGSTPDSLLSWKELYNKIFEDATYFDTTITGTDTDLVIVKAPNADSLGGDFSVVNDSALVGPNGDTVAVLNADGTWRFGGVGLTDADSLIARLFYMIGGDSTYYISTQAISAGEHCPVYVTVANGPDSIYFGTCTGGSGTTDSTYINDGTQYGPFTNDMYKIKEGTGLDITRQDSTTYDVFSFAVTLGTSVDTTERIASQWEEFVADWAGAMFSGNTETGITVAYDDADNTVDFTVHDSILGTGEAAALYEPINANLVTDAILTDTLNRYFDTTATRTEINKLADDTTALIAAKDSVAAWDNGGGPWINSLAELFGYFDRTYFDTLVDASGDSIIVLLADSAGVAGAVDWGDVTSIPAGFADGTDDVGSGGIWTATDSGGVLFKADTIIEIKAFNDKTIITAVQNTTLIIGDTTGPTLIDSATIGGQYIDHTDSILSKVQADGLYEAANAALVTDAILEDSLDKYAPKSDSGTWFEFANKFMFNYPPYLGNASDSANADSQLITRKQMEDSLAGRADDYQPVEATLTDIADGTITENLVNTTNPWADNEVASSGTWNAAKDSVAAWDNNAVFLLKTGGDVDSIKVDTLVIDDKITVGGGRIYGTQHLRVTILNPATAYATDAEVCLWLSTDYALTITAYNVTLNADPTTEAQFSLKFADAFIGLANAVVIDDSATAVGVTAVTGGFGDATVPAGKCIYLLFDAEPDAATTQMAVDIIYDYD